MKMTLVEIKIQDLEKHPRVSCPFFHTDVSLDGSDVSESGVVVVNCQFYCENTFDT